MDKVTLVILEGTPPGESSAECMVRAVRHAAIRDNCAKFGMSPSIGRKILITNDQALAESVRGYGCETQFFCSDEGFHFGSLLARTVRESGLNRVFYMGGGAGLFLSPEEIEMICRELIAHQNIFFANNYFSSDFVAFTPAAVLQTISLPAVDNLLAYLLKEEGGLEYRSLPPTWGTVFDIDTPADVMALSMLPGTGPETYMELKSLSLDTGRLKMLVSLFGDKNAELLFFGRINPRIITHMEAHVMCRLRFFSEERGMKARGRVERGEVGSVMGGLLQEVGLDNFFSIIGRYCHGAVLDSRLLFAHMGRRVSRKDRFLSDMGDYRSIEDDFVRRFTMHSVRAPIPVICAGHSMLSGGLWVLSEIKGERHQH